MTYATIHLWGDSLGKGVVFDEARGRYCITPERCVRQLDGLLPSPIVNHSRMGATVADGLTDFCTATPGPDALVVIEYGGNDCDMPWADVSANPEGSFDGRVPLPTFIQTLRSFVEAVRALHGQPLLVTPPPLDADRYFAWVSRGLSSENILRFLGDVQHIYRWQERYATAVRAVAAETRCALFDLRAALLDQRRYPALLCVDGIHLNADGQRAAADAVMAYRASSRTA